MKVIKIDKEEWAKGVLALADTWQIFGPAKEKDYHEFKILGKGELPEIGRASCRERV